MLNYTESNLASYSKWYGESIHGYFSLIVSVFGIILNFFNIIVLTRKNMLSSTNAILAALAISDFISMLFYIPSAIKFYILNQDLNINCSGLELYWTLYVLLHVNITVTMHSTSIWLTVLLALFRYVYICQNKLGKILCTRRNTIIAIFVIYLFCIILSIPVYLVSKVEEIKCSDNISNNNTKFYIIGKSELDVRLNGLLFSFTFILQAFCVKLIPCILVVILSTLLIHSIHKMNKNHKKLCALGSKKRRDLEKSKDNNQTNLMLVLVCFLFFVTEFPQGVLAFLSFTFESKNFHEEVYMKLGDTMDMLSLLNSALNFVLYCLMSKLFRTTFRSIFFCLKIKEEKERESIIRRVSRNNSQFYRKRSSFLKLLDQK